LQPRPIVARLRDEILLERDDRRGVPVEIDLEVCVVEQRCGLRRIARERRAEVGGGGRLQPGILFGVREIELERRIVRPQHEILPAVRHGVSRLLLIDELVEPVGQRIRPAGRGGGRDRLRGCGRLGRRRSLGGGIHRAQCGRAREQCGGEDRRGAGARESAAHWPGSCR
jgi:hypothetical protein